jgi:hypothetical protein
MDDERDEAAGFVGGPSMAFGAETRRLAQGTMMAGAVAAAAAPWGGQFPPREPLGVYDAQRVPRVGATFAARRVRNGWILSDGRGLEMIATSTAEAGAIFAQWMEGLEPAHQQGDRIEPAQAPGALPRGVGAGLP